METTRNQFKVVITPVDHYVGSRFSRRAWSAQLADRESGETVIVCKHSHGHRTIDAAKACGIALWRRQPV